MTPSRVTKVVRVSLPVVAIGPLRLGFYPCVERRSGKSTGVEWRVSAACQLIGRVEGRDLVALRQGRIIEDRIEEIVEPGPQAEHGLPDVEQLGGAGADDVDPEQPAVGAMEQQLEQPAVVTYDLSPGDLAIAS